jgi:hypothetical protein
MLHRVRRAERMLLSYERCGWLDDTPSRLTGRQARVVHKRAVLSRVLQACAPCSHVCRNALQAHFPCGLL